ncbi:glycosyltransferase family 2 protein [Iodobacter ciconiae]|uniref:Glycosyltransferase family 2 protein n=1 Tax=Iodobacter ciconiae TaxID=2496266 RepID=A0A3S8ZWL6_9NEIS|nr:glycosyltransferase family 2 protein [Iodobacter ciconiae]AZN37862.1 glycosyltransferase family 2 protein [Iodobacter ciconiae]
MRNVDAIVILYNPSVAQVTLFENAIKDQVRQIHFVDNSDCIDVMDVFAFDEKKSNYLSMNGNKGIAAAQNSGAEVAFGSGADFIVLFDQDSQITENFIEKLLICYEQANIKFNGNVAAIGPTPISDVTGQAYSRVIDRLNSTVDSFTDISQIIASGCLISKSAWSKVGGMREELFIDAVDHEWCWQAVSKGMKIIRSNDVLMPHRLGWYDVNVMGIKFCIGAPIRHYYQYRNYFYLLKFSHVPLYWKVKTGISYALKLFSYPVFVSPRISRLKFMLKGIVDGLRNKMGKIY